MIKSGQKAKSLNPKILHHKESSIYSPEFAPLLLIISMMTSHWLPNALIPGLSSGRVHQLKIQRTQGEQAHFGLKLCCHGGSILIHLDNKLGPSVRRSCSTCYIEITIVHFTVIRSDSFICILLQKAVDDAVLLYLIYHISCPKRLTPNCQCCDIILFYGKAGCSLGEWFCKAENIILKMKHCKVNSSGWLCITVHLLVNVEVYCF